MQPYPKKNNNDFLFQSKLEIYYLQQNHIFITLERQPIPDIQSHLTKVKSIQKNNGMIPCPFCINCYIHPGETIANDINKKYNLKIEVSQFIFDNYFIRPAYCTNISVLNDNDVNNGIFVCSQCFKLKLNKSSLEFFKNFLFFNGTNYQRRIDLPRIEIMDQDIFENKCFCCKEFSKHRICYKCASRKDEIICIAKNNI